MSWSGVSGQFLQFPPAPEALYHREGGLPQCPFLSYFLASKTGVRGMNILQRGLCLIHLLIYKFFMRFYWVSAPFLGTGDTEVHRVNKGSCPCRPYILVARDSVLINGCVYDGQMVIGTLEKNQAGKGDRECREEKLF